MNACEVLDVLNSSVEVDKENVDRLVRHYTKLYQTASDPITVARAATNLGFALTFVPSAIFSELLEYVKTGLNGLTNTVERARVHFELGQLFTRTRKDVLYEQARKHYHVALTELKQANLKDSSIGASILNGLALLSYLEGRYDEALRLEKQALLSLFCLPERPEIWQQRMVIALHTGDVYRKKLFEYDNAQHYYQLALNCSKHTGNPNDVILVQESLKSVEDCRSSNNEN
ncbi:tetratricopeptide repeat protein [Bacillus thuringiensis]|uniref:tetratricopeptide repeat protein n=1 Tax=Bacillus thuringiensis TaxID=1428 RepID=UPI002DBF0BB0|nr:tetratricopeptide repeat protein [Bacillus thuringiensis]MEC3225524.1 tetratricopeptide repeat protein [Bacillus thuringiensis]MEC3464682.1 tetratricopeptide repeat protein [Bacillus thuringiensis]MEC3556142.1 tetratricopeptide repeat protein [Bacillus thuringiensis]